MREKSSEILSPRLDGGGCHPHGSRVSLLLSVFAALCVACGDDRDQTRAALLDTSFLSAGDVSLRAESTRAPTFLDAPRRSGLGLAGDDSDDDDDDDRFEDDSRRGRGSAKRGKRRGRGHRD